MLTHTLTLTLIFLTTQQMMSTLAGSRQSLSARPFCDSEHSYPNLLSNAAKAY